MAFKFIKIEPPSRRYRTEDVAYVSLEDCPIGGIALEHWLLKGEPFDMEEVEKDRIANAKREDYGKTDEEAYTALHSEVAQEFVELLNLLVAAPGGGEFSEDSTFSLVEGKEEEE